ncbi:MAG: chemotaxis protein CheX [Moraxellaceae bacterium]
MSVNMPEKEHLSDITESVWTGFLDIPLARSRGEPEACECAASVSIKGAWNGSLVVCCSRQLAQRVASTMFQCDEEEMREALWSDALGEIANIIGGNIKAMLPAPSQLGLPRFHADWQPQLEGQIVAFRSDGEPLHVLLLVEAV